MSRFAPLLRALLCLALLFNGVAYAHAVTRMAVMDMTAALAVEDEPPCHEGMDMATPVAAEASSHHDDGASLPDCCKTGGCDGFCTQHAPALAWPASPGMQLVPRAEAPAYRSGAHASARLSHRHRPPILTA